MTAATLRRPPTMTTSAGARLATAVEGLGNALADAAAANDRDAAFAQASVTMLRDAGVLGACAPESDGGGGLTSLYDLAVLTGQIAEYDASVAIGVSMHFGLSWYFGRWQRVNPVVRVKGRFSRRLRYGNAELALER